MTKQLKFSLAVALQLLIIAVMIVTKLMILTGGTEVVLRIAPVDPNSPLRGDYVTFQYDISELESAYFDFARIKNGETVYVLLVKNGNYWIAQRALLKKPIGSDQIFIKGMVTSGDIVDQTDVLNQQFTIPRYHITYGVEEYFIPEGTGRNFSFFRKEAAARVVVDDQGEAVLKGILVAGKPWP